jgi:hypothetical protein
MSPHRRIDYQEAREDNSLPEPTDDPPLDIASIAAATAAVDRCRPNSPLSDRVGILSRSASFFLKRLLTGVGGLIHWLAAKSDLFVDALAEAAGKRTGKLIINGRSKFGDSQTARHRHSGGCLSDWTMASASISEILNLRPRS